MIGAPSRATHRPPGPRGTLLLGSLPAMQRKGMLAFYCDLWRDYGDMVHVKMGPLHQFLLTQPDHVHHVLASHSANYCKGIGFKKLQLTLGNGLFISEGELWQRQRRLLQPPFTAKAVAQFADQMVATTATMLDQWSTHAYHGTTLDINVEMMQLAMSIIGRTMFGTEVGAEALAVGDAFTYVLNFASERSVTLFDVPLFVPTTQNRRFKDAMHLLRTSMQAIITQRRQHPDGTHDLLTILLNARDETTGIGMSEQQLYDEVLTIFFAGHETTAQALTWTWYLLAQHPEVEQRLHEELVRVLGGRQPTYADVPQLTYTRMVIQEALRLYPPVWIFVRDAIAADEIGGYNIPPRSMIILSPYITHRHPALWDAPEHFDPERWTPERSAGRPHYAYFPFGGGKRTCLGDKFAMLEAQLVVATIAQRFRLRLASHHVARPIAVGTLRPVGGMPMILEAR